MDHGGLGLTGRRKLGCTVSVLSPDPVEPDLGHRKIWLRRPG